MCSVPGKTIEEQLRESHENYYKDLGAFVTNLRSKLPELEKLYEETGDHWTYEDLVYRFYHGSFKVFYLQGATQKIVEALQALAPEAKLNKMFLEIYEEAMSKRFVQDKDPKKDTNSNWTRDTRPLVEAFMHARYFLGMAVKYGKTMTDDGLRRSMPSGWAGLLCFYRLR